MRVACPHCPARYSVDDGRIPPRGVKVRCPKCQAVFAVRPPRAEARPADDGPAPPRPAPPAPEAFTAAAAPTAAAEPDADAFAAPRAAAELDAEAFAAPVNAPAARPSASALTGFDPAFAAFEPPELEAPRGAAPIDGGLSWTAPVEPFAAPAAEVEASEPQGLAAGDEPHAAERFAAPAAPPTQPAADPFADPEFSGSWGNVALPVDSREAGASQTSAEIAATEAFPGLEADTAVAPPSPPARGLGPLGASESQELEALFSADPGPAQRAAAAGAAPGDGDGPERTEVFGAPQRSTAPVASRPAPVIGRKREEDEEGGPDEAPSRFAAALRNLLRRRARPARRPEAQSEGRSPRPGASPRPRAAAPQPTAAARDRGSRLRRALPFAVAGSIALSIIGVGLGAGATRYGFFFYRAVTGQLGPNRPGAALLRDARARLAQGTYPAAADALRLSERALGLDASDLEAAAVFVQVAARLERVHGGGAGAFARAPALLTRLAKEAPTDPEALKARVAAALAPKPPVPLDSESALERHVAAVPADAAAVLLLAEAAGSKRDVPRALALFDRAAALDPRSASAPHGAGTLLAASGDAEGAARRFADALARDPSDVAATVELAGLAAAGGDAARARTLLDQALSDGARGGLGPRERARARTLRAGVLAAAGAEDPAGAIAASRKELEAALTDDPSSAAPRVALARLLLRQGDAAGALTALGPAGDAAPDLRALALAAGGKLLDASNAVDAALATRSSDAHLLHAKGVVAAALGKAADAEKAWASAIARDPAYAEPRVAMARARLAAGRREDALAEVTAALEHAPRDADAQAARGEIALSAGDLAAGRAAFEKALAADPTLAAARVGLARVALAAGDDAGAEQQLRMALGLAPRLRDPRRLLGELLWRKGDLAGAREALAAAVAIDPGDAVARARLGAVELERGSVDASLSELLAATNADPADPAARLWFGRALLAKGEVANAVEHLRRAVALAPGSPDAQLWLGAAQERAGNGEEALAAYRAASERSPKLLDPRERAAALLGLQGRWSDACAELERAIAIAPREARLKVALGDARMQMRREPEAVRLYRSALETDPKLVALNYKIARALHESSGMRAALPWYEKAARADAANGMPHYYLGFAYKDLRQRARAVEEFRAYLTKRPDAEDRRDIEREIEDLRAGER